MVDSKPRPQPSEMPALWEVRCSLPGCRWRVRLPFEMPEEQMAKALDHNGWRADEDSPDGLVCGRHGRGTIDA